jgi:hypothetical protein
MFETTLRDPRPGGPGGGAPAAAEVAAFADRLTGGTERLSDAERIDLLRALEVLKCAAEGAQAVVTADLDASQRAAAVDRGLPRERQGRGIAHQVALARRVSPHRGQRLTGLATVLVREMPCTLAALRAGRITEWSATGPGRLPVSSTQPRSPPGAGRPRAIAT